MNAYEIARLWANNKWVEDDWFEHYGKRQYDTMDDFIAVKQAHWVHNENRETVGTYDGYRLTACPVRDGWGYSIVTPWGASEAIGVVDPNGRNDEAAMAKLREVIALMPQAMEDVARERANKQRVVADATKTTIKRTAKPKVKPKDEQKADDEPKPAHKRGRGRPKGSKDSKPRKRRTKAQIAADAEVTVDAPTQSAIPRPKATPKPRRRRTKKQIIADAKRIVAEQRAERERNGLEPTEDEKRAQRRSQWLRDRPKAVRDELGRVRLGDMGMLVTNRMAWVPDSIGRYSPFPIWSDTERDYVLNDKFFVPVPENAIVSESQDIPGKVADANRRNHYIG